MKKQILVPVTTVLAFTCLSPIGRADTLLEKIATTILADKFGIDTRQVTVIREQTHLSTYDLSPILEGSHYLHQSPRSVLQLRNQGLGWGQIAHKLGMNPGTFIKLRNRGAFDRDHFWVQNYSERFGVPQTQVEVLRKNSGSLEDVLGAIIVGKLSKRDPRDVYNEFKAQRSWTTVSNSHNVNFESWKHVSTPIKSRFVVHEDASEKPKHNDTGARNHGNGHGSQKTKGNKSGNGNSNGKDKDKESGNGHGKGKGHHGGEGGG